MTNITTNGTTEVVLEVRDVEGLHKTIDNMVVFMRYAKAWGFDNSSLHEQSEQTTTNLLEETDFSDLSFKEIESFVNFVRVVGLDDYSYYTIAEYAYMYTTVLDKMIDED